MKEPKIIIRVKVPLTYGQFGRNMKNYIKEEILWTHIYIEREKG